MTVTPKVLAISGGIGGAKLALGLQRVLPAGELAVLVNTGDDFRHLGLAISPDLDTVLYTLAGVANTELGWGREGETWNFLQELARIGGPDWFKLGDRDLVVHVERTRRLAAGESLTSIMSDLALRFGVPTTILPMTDDHVATVLDTGLGALEFQDYFVRRRCEPAVTAVRYAGAETARPSAAVLELLASSELACIVLCPSNPYLSIGPILAMPGMRAALASCTAPIVVISPVIGGRAVKGPTVKLMRELGVEVSPRSIVQQYSDIIDGLVLDAEDAAHAPTTGVPTHVTQTLMQTLADRESLAHAALGFAGTLAQQAARRGTRR
jgi:LPPG:FO 2-phospho-L-lactate transferase